MRKQSCKRKSGHEQNSTVNETWQSDMVFPGDAELHFVMSFILEISDGDRASRRKTRWLGSQTFACRASSELSFLRKRLAIGSRPFAREAQADHPIPTKHRESQVMLPDNRGKFRFGGKPYCSPRKPCKLIEGDPCTEKAAFYSKKRNVMSRHHMCSGVVCLLG